MDTFGAMNPLVGSSRAPRVMRPALLIAMAGAVLMFPFAPLAEVSAQDKGDRQAAARASLQNRAAQRQPTATARAAAAPRVERAAPQAAAPRAAVRAPRAESAPVMPQVRQAAPAPSHPLLNNRPMPGGRPAEIVGPQRIAPPPSAAALPQAGSRSRPAPVAPTMPPAAAAQPSQHPALANRPSPGGRPAYVPQRPAAGVSQPAMPQQAPANRSSRGERPAATEPPAQHPLLNNRPSSGGRPTYVAPQRPAPAAIEPQQGGYRPTRERPAAVQEPGQSPLLANRPSPGGRPSYVPQQPPANYRPQPPASEPPRGGFDRPLRGDRPGYADRGGYRGDHWQHDRHYRPPSRPRSSLHISIGTHFGSPYYYAPPPAYIASPFVYYSTAYCAPTYSYYYSPMFPRPVYSYHYYPYYYPRSSFSISFGGGSFRSHYSWLYEYRFAHVPAYPVVYSTTLVRPAVIHVVEPVYVTSPSLSAPSLSSSTVAGSGWFGSSSVGSGSTGVILPPPQQAQEYPAVQAPQPRVTTGADLGHTYLQLGDGESAMRVLMDHIRDYPNDTQAIRAIAMAYLMLGEAENGIRQIGRAYRQSPWLASRPLTGLLSPQDHGYMLDIATQVAVQQNSADAWLTVAVLMQAEGRFNAARQAAQRARNAGLAPEVADTFIGALPVDGN
jgi:tetratricopeptide (TPR) repeat protein